MDTPKVYEYPKNLATIYDPEDPPVMVDGVYTPVGGFLGGLSRVSALDLNLFVVKRVLERVGFRFDDDGQVVEEDRAKLDLIVTANIMGLERGHGRYAGVKLGFGHLGTENVEKMCISSLKAINDAAMAVTHPHAPFDLVVASGTESLSRVPHSAEIRGKVLQQLDGVDHRGRPKVARTFYGDLTLTKERPLEDDLRLRDEVQNGLMCPLSGVIMGKTAERLAKFLEITKPEADAWAEMSHINAAAAGLLGPYDGYVAPVPGTPLIYHEGIVTDRIALEGIYKTEKFVFAMPECDPPVITPRNACPLNDGAGAAVIMRAGHAEEAGHRPLGRLLGYAAVGVDPSIMGLGPSPAIWMLLEATKQKLGIGQEEVGVVNINEAFAAQVLACRKDLEQRYGIAIADRLNLDGGSVAVGHPVGATLTRIVIETFAMLRARNLRYGIAAACVGGGMGGAMLLENPAYDDQKPSERRPAVEVLEEKTGVERYKAIRRLMVHGNAG